MPESPSAADFLGARVHRLRERIEWIRDELSARSALHSEFEEEIEHDIRQLSSRTSSMSYPEIRQQLDNEVRKLKKDRRNNATRAWKDALDLTDKLLELIDEYERLRMVDGLVGRRGSV